MSSQNVHAGHRQRLRERFINNGLETFLPHQMLELLLFYAIPREDTNVHAHQLLERFKDLSGVFSASKEELCEVAGIGENAASLIKLIPQFCEIFNDLKIDRMPLDTRRKICSYFSDIFKNESEQKLYLACLDDSLTLIKLSSIDFDDRFDSSVMRVMSQEIIKTNCTQCIIATNHIKGYATPTHHENIFVKTSKALFAAMNVSLAEFVIYGTDGIRLILDASNSGII